MSLTTYTGLIAAIPGWSTYSDVATYLDDYIAWANQEINRRLRANVMLASADVTIDAETISQPTGFLAFKRLYLDLTPRRQVMTCTAETAMDLSSQYSSSSYPTHVATEGTLLRFAPLFTGSVTGKALYYKEVTAPSSDNATNAVMTKYPYLYLYGAMEALHLFKEDEEQVAVWGGRFGSLIEDINTRDAKDSTGGQIQAQPYPGAIV